MFLFLVAGVISDVSNEARERSDFREGDKVMALVGGGGYAGTDDLIRGIGKWGSQPPPPQ